MKTLFHCLAALTLMSASSATAGDCRTGYPTWQPPACEIRPAYGPVILDPCPPQPAVTWPGHCRISVCPEPTCRIVVCQKTACHRCGAPICHCDARPTCRISVCEPVPPAPRCRLICHPVTSCRIRPADPVITNPELPWPHWNTPEPHLPVDPTAVEPPLAPAQPGFADAPAAPVLPTPGGPVNQAPQQLPQVAPGQQISIEGAQFGTQPGQVTVHVGGLQLAAPVVSWSSGKVDALIPELPLSAAANAQVAVRNAQGQVTNQLEVMMVPGVTVPQQVAGR